MERRIQESLEQKQTKKKYIYNHLEWSDVNVKTQFDHSYGEQTYTHTHKSHLNYYNYYSFF